MKEKYFIYYRVQNGSPGSTRFYGPVHLRRHCLYIREASEICTLGMLTIYIPFERGCQDLSNDIK